MRRLVFVLALAACGKNQTPPPPSSGPFGATESGPSQPKLAGAEPSRAEKMFKNICAQCHGLDGSGNGAAAAMLSVKPRNYTDPKWQASTTDDDIRKIIVHGGAAVGKSEIMGGHPELEQQPEVLDGLVKIIRGFGQQ